MRITMPARPLLAIVCAAVLAASADAQSFTDKEIAARYAPVFYQALSDKPRNDYITNFDFDGDWRGDNNWVNTDDKRFAMRAYVYYSVSQTATHYFIHYAVFHPRDTKGGEKTGVALSELLRKSAEALGTNDPSGLLDKMAVAHENDMEGCLLAVPKSSASRIVYMETVSHNSFPRYTNSEKRGADIGELRLDDVRARLYVEPKGHGISAYTDAELEPARSKFVVYRFEGKAEDPEKKTEGTVGYELLPISTTLWPKAVGTGVKKGPTYGDAKNYSAFSITIGSVSRKIDVGNLGSAFLGKEGGVNMARPPWGWFDLKRRDDPPGIWFFDPATVIKRDFDLGKEFSTVYTATPFWATSRVKR